MSKILFADTAFTWSRLGQLCQADDITFTYQNVNRDTWAAWWQPELYPCATACALRPASEESA